MQHTNHASLIICIHQTDNHNDARRPFDSHAFVSSRKQTFSSLMNIMTSNPSLLSNSQQEHSLLLFSKIHYLPDGYLFVANAYSERVSIDVPAVVV